MSKVGAVAFVWHMHQPFFSSNEEIITYIFEFYHPLVKIHADLNLPLGLNISGVLLDKLINMKLTFINEVKRLVQRGLVEILASTYAHAIGFLIPLRHLELHVKYDLTLKQKIFQTSIYGFWPNDLAWFQTLAHIVVEHGLKYLIIEPTGIQLALSRDVWKLKTLGDSSMVSLNRSTKFIQIPDEMLYCVYKYRVDIEKKSFIYILLRNSKISWFLASDAVLFSSLARSSKSLDTIIDEIIRLVDNGAVFIIGGDAESINPRTALNYKKLLISLKERGVRILRPYELIKVNKEQACEIDYICSHTMFARHNIFMETIDDLNMLILLRDIFTLEMILCSFKGIELPEWLQKEILVAEDSGFFLWRKKTKKICINKLIKIIHTLQKMLGLKNKSISK